MGNPTVIKLCADAALLFQSPEASSARQSSRSHSNAALAKARSVQSLLSENASEARRSVRESSEEPNSSLEVPDSGVGSSSERNSSGSN